MKSQIAVFLLVNIFAVALAYPNGAPSSERVCKYMNAGHGPGPQDSGEVPYTVNLNSNKISAGQGIKITISGDDGELFKGFYCQVRDPSDTPIGKFLKGSSYKSGDCGNLKENAATHTEASGKESINLNWQSPQDYQGKATVVCTVLKDFDTFWTFVKPVNSVTVQ